MRLRTVGKRRGKTRRKEDGLTERGEGILLSLVRGLNAKKFATSEASKARKDPQFSSRRRTHASERGTLKRAGEGKA